MNMDLKRNYKLNVIHQVSVKELTTAQAAKILCLSQRQIQRNLKAYYQKGSSGLVNGNTGREAPNALPEELRQRVIELAQSTYSGLSTLRFKEILEEKEDIHISVSSVRRILISAGIINCRNRRLSRYPNRESHLQEGALLQLEYSNRDWLEGWGNNISLIGVIDDVNGKIYYAIFRERDDDIGYFLLYREIILKHGIPLAIHISHRRKRKSETIEEQLEGVRKATQCNRLLKELGITPIYSRKRSALKRIEGLWRTFEDEVLRELRSAGVSTVEEANQLLTYFIPRYNQRFSNSMVKYKSAFRDLDKDFKSEDFFCFKYTCSVKADNTIAFNDGSLKILPTNDRVSYARCKVQLYETLDDSLAVYYQGRRLPIAPAPNPIVVASTSSES
jgi:transposase